MKTPEPNQHNVFLHQLKVDNAPMLEILLCIRFLPHEIIASIPSCRFQPRVELVTHGCNVDYEESGASIRVYIFTNSRVPLSRVRITLHYI